MSLFERNMFASTGDEAGVFMEDFAKALLTWAAMNYGRELTIADATLAFNTTPDAVRAAINEGYWISYYGPDDDPTKQSIELDGE